MRYGIFKNYSPRRHSSPEFFLLFLPEELQRTYVWKSKAKIELGPRTSPQSSGGWKEVRRKYIL